MRFLGVWANGLMGRSGAAQHSPSVSLSARWLCTGLLSVVASAQTFAAEPPWKAMLAKGELVDIRRYDPSFVVELRYATAQNCVGTAIYPKDFPCLTRPETAVRLHLAQQKLHDWGYRIKIWDAYRPPEAQAALYRRWAGRGFVADPDTGGGSLHTRGLAVDATLVDLVGREVSMPSGFDIFVPEASAVYAGNNARTAFHLHLLQAAMGAAGFEGLRNEWWHFVVKGWATRGSPGDVSGPPAATPPPRARSAVPPGPPAN